MFEKYISRYVEGQIKKRLFESGKISVLYGPRQVGKTMLSKKILKDYDSEGGYFNCEDKYVRDVLLSQRASTMHALVSGHKVIVFDEAQTVENIGLSLKILIDAHPELCIIATGSSSFELANKLGEPLTGRHFEYFLYPFAFSELSDTFGAKTLFDRLNERLVFGGYPEIVLAENMDERRERISLLSKSYLYRDVFKYRNIKNPEVLGSLLSALAHQVGSEVSMNELSSLIGVSKDTVATYIRLLEQAFIIFRLPSYSRNMRNEIRKGKKFYFFDNGTISALTDNFSGPETGRNIGGLWENLMVTERLKHNQRNGLYKALYFWRLKNGGEIDLIEESDGKVYPYELKWNSGKIKPSARKFQSEYSSTEIKIISKNNFFEFAV